MWSFDLFLTASRHIAPSFFGSCFVAFPESISIETPFSAKMKGYLKYCCYNR